MIHYMDAISLGNTNDCILFSSYWRIIIGETCGRSSLNVYPLASRRVESVYKPSFKIRLVTAYFGPYSCTVKVSYPLPDPGVEYDGQRGVEAVGGGGAVLAHGAVHEAQVLEQHQLAVLLHAVQHLVSGGGEVVRRERRETC